MPSETPPPISERFALLAALLFAVLYVAPFYLSPTLRTSPRISRDDPAVIRARVRAVALSGLASTLIAVAVLLTHGHATPRQVLRLCALWPVDPLDCLKVLTLVAVLFAAPLYELLVVDAACRHLTFSPTVPVPVCHRRLAGFRNYIVAPWCEELVFRSLVLALYQRANVPPARIVFTTPLIFGVAHLHHLVEFLQSRSPPARRRTLPPAPIVLAGVLQSLFQFTYTALFGFFAAFVMLRTGNVFASVTAHTFCNVMGFPRIWGRLGRRGEAWDAGGRDVMTPDVAQGEKDEAGVGNGWMREPSGDEKNAAGYAGYAMKTGAPRGDLGVAWTVPYYLLFVGGAYAFHRLLWRLTESGNALVKF